MKNSKKVFSLLLAVAMIFSVCFGVYAAEDTTGTITVDNAVTGQTYTAYQILDLESYNAATGAYSYKAAADWKSFVESEDVAGIYLTTDSQGYVTWVEGADAAAFAKAAQAYAKANEIACQGETTATETTVTFTGLDLGYYLVDTSLGTICSLDTTNPDVVIKEKNEETTVEKVIVEDGIEKDENVTEIGDTVDFKITISAKAGAEKYVLHDEMSEGLTLKPETIKVMVGEEELDSANYTVVTEGLSDGCDFEITFTQDYLDSITADTDIVITYSAVLNENAEITEIPNTNKTRLEYGDDTTVEDETKTYTYEFDIIKTDSDKKLLEGAEFELYDAQTSGNKISLVEENGVYRVATDEEISAEGFVSAVIKAGQANIIGLDDKTYWLEETKAPEGYNKLPARVEVDLTNGSITTTMTGDIWQDGDGGVQITNKTGAELPSTGGMGTTLFYTFGSIMVLLTGVMLFVRKRMSVSSEE